MRKKIVSRKKKVNFIDIHNKDTYNRLKNKYDELLVEVERNRKILINYAGSLKMMKYTCDIYRRQNKTIEKKILDLEVNKVDIRVCENIEIKLRDVNIVVEKKYISPLYHCYLCLEEKEGFKFNCSHTICNDCILTAFGKKINGYGILDRCIVCKKIY